VGESRVAPEGGTAGTEPTERDRALQGILSETGFKLWRRRSQQFDSTPTVSDTPAEQDALGRAAFAEALARRIRAMRRGEPHAPLLIHLHGPWGSGKTSILNFMRGVLAKRHEPFPGEAGDAVEARPFLAVDFNAWQYQHVSPPWWPLLGAVTSQVFWSLVARGGYLRAVALLLRRFLFKVWTVKSLTVLAGLVAVLVGGGLLALSIERGADAAFMADTASLAGLFGIVGGLFAAFLTFFGVLFPKPEEAAARYVSGRNDPLLRLQRHIERFVEQLCDPVVILVDDLDRCDGAFVVRFLEGIQTLFRGAPIVFVVAADRKWVHQSFEKVYADFAPTVSETGKPLGFLFLEKTFQMSVAVPPLRREDQARYLRSMLGLAPAAEREAERRRESEARRDVGTYETEGDIVDRVGAQPADARAAFARAAVVRLAAPEVELQVTRHRLAKFSPLLEANPRAMKRLIMAYGMNQATDLLLEQFTDLDKLALWTILSMRWPILAEWLEAHPADIARLEREADEGVAAEPGTGVDEIDALFRTTAVRDVLRGRVREPDDPSNVTEIVPGGLDHDTLTTLSGRASTL
jgi:hypothetical protein